MTQESPRESVDEQRGICQCENQLAHWDWAGRELSNLPEPCRRRLAIEEDGKLLFNL
jgi:hypothetical protein